MTFRTRFSIALLPLNLSSFMGSKLQPWPCKDPNNLSQLILKHSKSKMTSDANQPTHHQNVALSDQVSTPEVKNTEEKVRHKRTASDLATPERTPKHPTASTPPDTSFELLKKLLKNQNFSMSWET